MISFFSQPLQSMMFGGHFIATAVYYFTIRIELNNLWDEYTCAELIVCIGVTFYYGIIFFRWALMQLLTAAEAIHLD